MPGGRRGVWPAEACSMLRSKGGGLAGLAELGMLSEPLLVDGEGILRGLRRGRVYTAGSESEGEAGDVLDRLLGWLKAARGLGDLEATLPGPAWAGFGAHARRGLVCVKRAAASVVGSWEGPCRLHASMRVRLLAVG